MLDLKLLRKEPELIEKALQTKDSSVKLSFLLEMDEQLRRLKVQVEELKSKRNDLSQQIGWKKAKQENTDDLLAAVNSFSLDLEVKEKSLFELENSLEQALLLLPNIPSPSAKISSSPSDNVCIALWKEKPTFSFAPKNHVELNEKLQLFDFVRGAKIAGSGWPIYRNMGARLEWALINFMIDFHIENGFEFILPSHLVRPEIMQGSGQLPKFTSQLFTLQDKDYDLYLIPTSEAALNGMHYQEIFKEEELPKKYVSYTPCFRREAGAAGSSERGLIRMHQFNKVEMFAFTKPEDSPAMMQLMQKSAARLLEALGIHYRAMHLVTGDMSFAASETIDMEVWLPGQNRYYEVSSISNCTDFQARRSKIRFKHKEEKPEFVHTLNGSGLATSRLMVAILENNQQEDGSVSIPVVLQKYLGNVKELRPNCSNN